MFTHMPWMWTHTVHEELQANAPVHMGRLLMGIHTECIKK